MYIVSLLKTVPRPAEVRPDGVLWGLPAGPLSRLESRQVSVYFNIRYSDIMIHTDRLGYLGIYLFLQYFNVVELST